MYIKFNIVKFIIILCGVLFIFSDVYSACKNIRSRHGGPYDYRNPKFYSAHGAFSRGAIPMVTGAHFKPDVANLTRKRGQGNGRLEDEISYTLREIANHPRALNTASLFEYKKVHNAKFRNTYKKLETSAECYLKRAIKLYPKDTNVYFVYGIHLHRFNKYEQAIVMYKHALKLTSKFPEAHYNLGLAYVKVGDIKKANEHAKIAYNGGYKLPGLQRQINQYEKNKEKTTSTGS